MPPQSSRFIRALLHDKSESPRAVMPRRSREKAAAGAQAPAADLDPEPRRPSMGSVLKPYGGDRFGSRGEQNFEQIIYRSRIMGETGEFQFEVVEKKREKF